MAEFTSTRNGRLQANACEAVFNGIVPDGGLYVPVTIPHVSYEEMLSNSFAENAKIILKAMLPAFTAEEISESADGAYLNHFDTDAVAPVKKVGEAYILELFHGETAAFKDVALSILPRLMTRARRSLGKTEKILILTATSGDTGSAAMNGFRDVDGTGIITFYPYGGVSDIQKAQMTAMRGENLAACALRGNFDDCQTTVKRIFASMTPPQGIHLSSANSINIARLAPQITYYFTSYCALVNANEIQKGDHVDFVVPTGNFGDILAGFYAKLMGLPVGRLVCASNANRVLTDFIQTGVYNKSREFKKTISPSMDILISSNLERLLYLAEDEDDALVRDYMQKLSQKGEYMVSNRALRFIQESFSAYSFSDDEAMAEIRRVYLAHGYLLDPHTAVAHAAMRAHAKTGGANKSIVLSTASPFKFVPSVLTALQRPVPESAFEGVRALEAYTGIKAPSAITALENAEIVSRDVIDIDGAFEYVLRKAESVCKG